MELTFAAKLRTQAQDKKTAIFEAFIEQTITLVKRTAERQANHGYFECKIESTEIPVVILRTMAGREERAEIYQHIISNIEDKLQTCGFTKLLVYPKYAGSSSSNAVTVECQWV